MPKQPVILQKSEWIILEKLWEKPRSLMQLVHALQSETGWSKSTVNTLLARMLDKGLIACREGERARLYSPAIDRERAALDETESLLTRVYHGSVSLMMSTLARKKPFSREEIAELKALLKEMDEP